MNWAKFGNAFKLFLAALWLLFTVAFALWWFKFSLENIAHLAGLEPGQVEHWNRQRRMIFWEGTSWIVLLFLGGAALIALVQRERWRARRIKEFFASFSHEIKTSLASLRVQAEALQDEKIQSPVLDRLIGDTVRLQLQLENSLFLSSQDDLQLFLRPLRFRELLERMREQWPGLTIDLTAPCTVLADERALRTIFSNLLQNAIVHGGATRVVVEPHATSADRVAISLRDNGRGFAGSGQKLGGLFHRPTPSSGSGLGLYICRLLVKKMNGELTFMPGSEGFQVKLTLEGSLS